MSNTPKPWKLTWNSKNSEINNPIQPDVLPCVELTFQVMNKLTYTSHEIPPSLTKCIKIISVQTFMTCILIDFKYC